MIISTLLLSPDMRNYAKMLIVSFSAGFQRLDFEVSQMPVYRSLCMELAQSGRTRPVTRLIGD